MRRLLGSGIVTLAALLVLSGEGVANDPPLIAQVRAAWKERQDKVRTAKFEWTQTVFTVKGGDFEGGIRSDGKYSPPLPPEDHSYTSHCTLTIDGNKVAYKFLRRFWSADQRKYNDIPTEYKFDGKKQLSLNHPGSTPWAQALIRAEPRGAELPYDTRPVLRTLRGTNPHFRPDDLDEYLPTGATIPVDGGRGSELHSKGSPTRSEQRLWIDPGRGFVAPRYLSGPATQPVIRIDVKYRPDPNAGWVPTGWTIVMARMTDGRVICTWTAKVTVCTLNEPIDPEAFAFTLPAGTRVVDETRKPQDYILREDGSKRVIGPREFGKSYQELMSTPGPESEGSWWRRRAGLLLAAFVGAGIILVAARVWLSRKPAGRQPDSAPDAAGSGS
jgi:hypothetical protein